MFDSFIIAQHFNIFFTNNKSKLKVWIWRRFWYWSDHQINTRTFDRFFFQFGGLEPALWNFLVLDNLLMRSLLSAPLLLFTFLIMPNSISLRKKLLLQSTSFNWKGIHLRVVITTCPWPLAHGPSRKKVSRKGTTPVP